MKKSEAITPAAAGKAVGDSGGRGLAFDWKRHHWISFRIIFFIILSATAHAFSFYLFRVVYPPSERFTPVPARITLLSVSDPRTRGMLRELEDRVVYYDSSTRDSIAEKGIEDLAVAYRPSYAGYDPALRKPSKTGVSAGADAPYPSDGIVFPEETAAAEHEFENATGEGKGEDSAASSAIPDSETERN